ncbi:MAG: hypothetical protein ACREDE_11225, partial [Thermoplasmata archaeon]
MSAELVVTVTDGADDFASGGAPLSVTFHSKVYEVLAARVSAGIEHVSVDPALAPPPLSEPPQSAALVYVPPLVAIIHRQEYGAVPVDGIVPVTVSAW